MSVPVVAPAPTSTVSAILVADTAITGAGVTVNDTVTFLVAAPVPDTGTVAVYGPPAANAVVFGASASVAGVVVPLKLALSHPVG